MEEGGGSRRKERKAGEGGVEKEGGSRKTVEGERKGKRGKERRMQVGEEEGAEKKTGVEAREKEKVDGKGRERERELCFPGLFLEGRRQDAGAPPMGARAGDFAPLRFAAPCFLRGVAAAEKSAEKEATTGGRGPRPLAPRSLFFAFREPLRGQWHIAGRKERPRNR